MSVTVHLFADGERRASATLPWTKAKDSDKRQLRGNDIRMYFGLPPHAGVLVSSDGTPLSDQHGDIDLASIATTESGNEIQLQVHASLVPGTTFPDGHSKRQRVVLRKRFFVLVLLMCGFATHHFLPAWTHNSLMFNFIFHLANLTLDEVFLTDSPALPLLADLALFAVTLVIHAYTDSLQAAAMTTAPVLALWLVLQRGASVFSAASKVKQQ